MYIFMRQSTSGFYVMSFIMLLSMIYGMPISFPYYSKCIQVPLIFSRSSHFADPQKFVWNLNERVNRLIGPDVAEIRFTAKYADFGIHGNVSEELVQTTAFDLLSNSEFPEQLALSPIRVTNKDPEEITVYIGGDWDSRRSVAVISTLDASENQLFYRILWNFIYLLKDRKYVRFPPTSETYSIITSLTDKDREEAIATKLVRDSIVDFLDHLPKLEKLRCLIDLITTPTTENTTQSNSNSTANNVMTTESHTEIPLTSIAPPTPATKAVITPTSAKLNLWAAVITVSVLVSLIFFTCIYLLFCQRSSGSFSRPISLRNSSEETDIEVTVQPPVEEKSDDLNAFGSEYCSATGFRFIDDN